MGAGDRVVGVSHECDVPAETSGLPRLTAATLALPDDPAEIDRQVSTAAATGTALYRLDEERLAELDPDLVVAQALCPVCAVTDEAVAGCLPDGTPTVRGEVFSWEASTLDGVLSDVVRLGHAAGAGAGADRLGDELERRLAAVRLAAERQARPRVVALEWLDPPWLGGHWVPEMIAAAGGQDVLATAGEPSRRATWDEIAASDPDWILAMPCGFDQAAARRQVADRHGEPAWDALRAVRSGQVVALDGGGLFSRPGPRLVDGVERLARSLS